MKTSRVFIDLDRRFREVGEVSDVEQTAYGSYLRLIDKDSGLDWDELLKATVTVLLGEPGSGKTWELRNRVEVLRNRGENAFFVPLDRLVAGPVSQAIEPNDEEALRTWMKRGGMASFFLDSVDEAKIRKQTDFGKALDGFVRSIGVSKLHLVKMVVSSRISDWRAQTDKEEVLSRFHIPGQMEAHTAEESGGESPFRIVELQPLDEKRVRAYAQGVGLRDADAFVDALDVHHAWEFARRPIDVAGLIEYWRERGQLGTLTELIEFDLNKRLRETEERTQRDPLSPRQAREGAQILGAAVVFCKRFNFVVPDPIPVETEDAAMDARESLPWGWTPQMSHAMLARALFDSASYGRIRFHHRRTAEYLACEWLKDRMRQGCPYPVLENLLFSAHDNGSLIRPSLRSVAAWLAIGEDPWAMRVRARILSSMPHLFLSYGDAESLPLEYKRSLLRSLVSHYAGRDRIYLDSEAEALSRLSDARLAPDINELLDNPATPSDIRTLLLEIVRHGRLSGSLATVIHIVASQDESDLVKSYAVAAIRDMGDQTSRVQLAEIAAGMDSIDDHLCSLLVEALFPCAIDPSGLVGLLRKAKYNRVDSTTISWSLKYHLQRHLPDEQSADVLSELVRLSQEPPHIYHDKKETVLSARFRWLCEVVPIPLLRLLKRPLLQEGEVGIAGDAVWLLSQFDRYDRIDKDVIRDMNSFLGKHPPVRRAFVLKTIAGSISGNVEKLRPYHIFAINQIVREDERDIEWLLPEIKRENPLVVRMVMLRLAIDVWRTFGRKKRIWRGIVKAIRGDQDLRVLLKSEAGRGVSPWLRRLWFRYWNLYLNRRRRSIPRRLRESYWNIYNQIWFLWNIDRVRNGTALNALNWLVREASESTQGNKWGVETLEPLIAKRGARIAQAAAMGWNVVWRHFDPPLPFEKPNSNQTDGRVIIGLSGINIALSNGELKFGSLTDEEACLAAAYAVSELNGFAEWLPELALSHPNSVRRVLTRCVRGEWATPSEREHPGETLYDLAYHGETLAPMVEGVILDELSACDPGNYKVLEYSLSILLKLPESPRKEIAQFAAERALTYPRPSQFFTLWMMVWLQLDADVALTCLKSATTGSPEDVEAIVRIFGALSPRHNRSYPLIKEPAYERPGLLRDLIPFVFEYVRQEDDINRVGGGAYSPTLRDDAQEFRNGLLQRLANCPGREAGSVLLQLSEDRRFARYRDWILHLYQGHEEAEAELTPWQPKDVRLFERDFETEPRSDHDLFRIGINRLRHIKDEVERGEISSRYDLHPDDDESRLRSWLARRLRELSRDRYKVPQEEEIDKRQRPDLRIEVPGMRPISMELKWTDNWSLTDLIGGLVDQLAGQYLRAPDNNYGVYVVGYKGTKKLWQDRESGSTLDYTSLVVELQKKADAVMKERFDIDGLLVVGMDFSRPIP